MMDLIDRAALLRTFDTVQKSDPMADNGRGYDDHFINADGEPSTEWFCVEDYVLKMPTIPAVPLGPLCEWLAGYADPPKYAMKIIPEGGEYLINARAKAWKHHFRNMMECGLMEEGQHDKG